MSQKQNFMILVVMMFDSELPDDMKALIAKWGKYVSSKDDLIA